ncbi:MAG: hypothetical protein RLZZ602_948 [Pseudomonadota bacterium]
MTKLPVALALTALSALAQAETPSESLYADRCATCHSASFRGSAHGAALLGQSFVEKWAARPASELLDYSRNNMPPGEAQTLTDAEHLSLVKLIVAANAGDLAGSELLASAESLALPTKETEAIEFSGADAIMDIARSAGRYNERVATSLSPVTDQELQSPPAADWLSWRRTLDGHGHSPLDSIHRGNVKRLTLSWSMAMHEGSNQGTPIIRDGVMFLTHPNNKIQAIEASSGTLLWEYQYEFPQGSRLLGGPTRNIAIYGDKLFLATYDAAVVAIDAKTGKQLWRTQKADYREAFTHSAGPIIANGVVVSGINGCELFTESGCFITGHDPDTGAELWRTSTLAAPDSPEYATWGDVAPDRRGGGDMWIAGSYDSELDLVIFGTSQPKPWAAASRNMTVEDAALYTNSTLAVRPQTGELVWHFQHIPGETIDMEVGFERVLADIDGKAVVLTMGKDGILWKLDRATGQYMALIETMEQNIFDVDAVTGRLKYRPDIANAGVGDTFNACPGIYGGHNWQSMSYNAKAETLYIPLHQLCSDMTPRAVDLGPGGGGYGADVATYPMPGKEKLAGKLIAVNAADMNITWEKEQEALFLSGALSTDGNLIFIGDLDRRFQAIDAETGETLWSTRLPAPAHGYPVTYEADGRQFVAVQTGMGVFRALTAVIFPDIYQPPSGQTLLVFELAQD